jgi:hypothetical protein
MKSTKQHPKYWLNQGTRYQFRIWNVQVFAQNMGPCFPWPKTRFAVTCPGPPPMAKNAICGHLPSLPPPCEGSYSKFDFPGR